MPLTQATGERRACRACEHVRRIALGGLLADYQCFGALLGVIASAISLTTSRSRVVTGSSRNGCSVRALAVVRICGVIAAIQESLTAHSRPARLDQITVSDRLEHVPQGPALTRRGTACCDASRGSRAADQGGERDAARPLGGLLWHRDVDDYQIDLVLERPQAASAPSPAFQLARGPARCRVPGRTPRRTPA